MKWLKENKAMQNDLISCITMVALGYLYMPDSWKKVIGGIWVLFFAAYSALVFWKLYRDKHISPEEKRELEREQTDERSQMIQAMAIQYCWTLENALLLIAFVVFVIRDQQAVLCVLYVILAVKVCASTALRWWLERRY